MGFGIISAVRLLVCSITAVALLALPGVALGDTYETPGDDTDGLTPPSVSSPNPPPSVSGTAQVGGTLSGSRGTWDSSTSLSSQWLRCNPAANFCDPTGDTDLTYAVTQADLGAVIVLRVAGRETQLGSSRTRFADAVSNPIAAAPTAVAPTAPVAVGAPAITGEAREGQTLRANPGQFTGTGPISFTYRWGRCKGTQCTVSSNTTSSYRLGSADVGSRIVLAVTASNVAGSAGAVASTGAVRDLLAGRKRLSPFPRLLVDGRVAGATTVISTLRLGRVPGGATISTSCTGRGCPFKTSRVRVKGKKSRTVALRRLQRRMRAGAVVVITVRKGDALGKYIRLKFRRGSAPARVDRCVVPKSSKPYRCP